MIRKLTLRNFKAHWHADLRLSPLTLLTGANGTGKSAVIQALLLLRQSYQHNQLQKGLQLNKPLCEIGLGQDALCEDLDADQIRLGITDDEHEINWSFQVKGKDLDATFLKVVTPQELPAEAPALFTENFQYLSAERLSSQESYEKDNYSVESERQISKNKGRGELVAHFLDFFGRREAAQPIEALRFPASDSPHLIDQTNYWLQQISPDVRVKVVSREKYFELSYQFEIEGQAPTRHLSPANVGFGIAYALPVIVAVLSARPGSLIIIENPEAHLHPSGQAKLMELFTLAAEAGIQILLETHSDHILNGALVAVKQGRIKPENTAVHYFARQEGAHTAFAEEITISEYGSIDYQPDGFFDQIEKDMDVLLGLFNDL